MAAGPLRYECCARAYLAVFPLFKGRCEYDVPFVAFPSRVRPLTILSSSTLKHTTSNTHTLIPTLVLRYSLYPLRCLPRKTRSTLSKQPTLLLGVADGQWASFVFQLFVSQLSLLQTSEESRTCQGATGPGGQARWPWRPWRSRRRSCRSYGYQARVQKVSDACLPYICVR